jgi:Spy/CpxP family protein refolding chaperone
MKLTFLSLSFLVWASVGMLPAQTPPEDPFRDILFPPELVVQNQQALGLSEDQKNYLKSELTQAQTHFAELQWKLQGEMERLVSMLKQATVDERATIAQLDNVLAAEREVKRTQVALLVRIKNHLRPEQQVQLREIQSKMRSGK